MTAIFLVLAIITIVGMGAAMSLRNPVHCVVALTVGLIGLAALYLQLDAQFVGFTQVLVYVGAVAILFVFAIMMTRSAETVQLQSFSSTWFAGLLIAVLSFATLAWAVIVGTKSASASTQPDAAVKQIGIALLHRFAVPLEITGLLLTAALIGAGVLALDEAQEVRSARKGGETR